MPTGTFLGSVYATLEIDPSGVKQGVDTATSEFKRLEQEGAKKLQSIGQGMEKVGKTMTVGLTLPIIAAGSAAVKFGTDFESILSKMIGLVGVSKDEVDGFRESILKLSGEVGKTPDELADAMFFITSAGFRGSIALDALETSAKASAAGMGETKDIAKATTGVLNAYGAENISVTKAIEIMVGTARAGNFETNQFADSLGRVTPFAQAAGGSFEDVGGAIALLTRTNNDAILSITQTSALFRAFSAPTQQTIDAFEELELTTDQVRQMIGEKGLVGTLRYLDERLEGNRDVLRKIIPDSQGFSAAISILNADAETITNTFGAVADSTGIVDSAFNAADETTKQKFNKSIASLQASLITLSDSVLPTVNEILDKLINLINSATTWFNNLDDGTKKTIITILGIVAALGPFLLIGGKIIQMIAFWQLSGLSLGKMIGGLTKTIGVFGKALIFLTTNPIGITILAIAAIVAVAIWMYKNWDMVKDNLLFIWETLKEKFTEVWNNIKDFIFRVTGAIADFVGGIWEGIKTFLSGIWEGIKSTASTIWDSIWKVIEAPVNLAYQLIRLVFYAILAVCVGVWNGILVVTTTVWNTIKSFVTTTWNNIKTVATTVWNAIVGFLKPIWDRVKYEFQKAWHSISGFFYGIWDSIKGAATGVWNAIVGVVNKIWSKISEPIQKAVQWGKDLLDNFGSGIWNKLSILGGTISQIYNKVKDKIMEAVNNTWNWGRDMIQNFINGIKNKINAVGDAVSEVADKIKGFLGFSIPDEGPLAKSDKWMPDMIRLLTDSMKKGEPMLARAASSLASGIAGNMAVTPSVRAVNAISGASSTSPSQITVSINNPTFTSELDVDRVFEAGARRLELALKGIPK